MTVERMIEIVAHGTIETMNDVMIYKYADYTDLDVMDYVEDVIRITGFKMSSEAIYKAATAVMVHFDDFSFEEEDD